MILIFDTSTNKLALGLASATGELLTEFYAEATPQERGVHDARLARETERMLRESNVTAREITRIGLVIGPGSFTGLRIGVAFAKGLAYATGALVVPLVQQEVLMLEGPGEYLVTPGYQKQLFYVADRDTPREVRLMTLIELSALPEQAILAHGALAGSKDLLPAWSITFAELRLQTLARLTAESTEALHGDALNDLEPLYITEFLPNAK